MLTIFHFFIFNRSPAVSTVVKTFMNQTLRKKIFEGFQIFYKTFVIKNFIDKSCIYQMFGCMLCTTNILIHWHPFIYCIGRKDFFLIIRINVPEIIPRRVHKCIHRIGVPLCRSSASWACCIHELGDIFQRRPTLWLKILYIFRKFHRQILLINRDNATSLAVNHRYGCPPVSLPRYQPIPQSIGNGFSSKSFLFQLLLYLLYPILGCQTCELPRVNHYSIIFKCFFHKLWLRCLSIHRFDNNFYG